MQVLPWGPLAPPWSWQIMRWAISIRLFKPHVARALHKYMYSKEYYTNQPIRILDGISIVAAENALFKWRLCYE